jgi:hypothetical protein
VPGLLVSGLLVAPGFMVPLVLDAAPTDEAAFCAMLKCSFNVGSVF